MDGFEHYLPGGSTAARPERIPLCAGPLTLVFEAGDLRDVTLGRREVVRRIYGAVRDREWRTIPATLSDLSILAGADRFRVDYRSEHREGPVDFAWRAAIEGEPDGTITFSFSGEAHSTFERNRIGLCVLHPIRECAGIPATARLTTGRSTVVAFPELVAVEQPINGFTDLAGLTYDVGSGRVDIVFQGDTFETEDQRNWIDASFKSYSTPLSLPRPVVVSHGTRVEQRVTLRVLPARHQSISAPVPTARAAEVRTRDAHERKVPAFGVGLGALQADVLPRELELLSELHPAHVRVDVPLADDDWPDRLARALDARHAAGCGLEIALHVGPECGGDLERLAKLLPHSAVSRLLVFSRDRATTTADALELVRTHLIQGRQGLGPVGVGSRVDLYEFHLYPPPPADLICWSMNPHAHASDLTSLAETPPAAAAQVRTVRRRHPGTLIAISPVTLGPRPRPSDSLSPVVHPLHSSLFGAAWTLAMASHLAAAGADSATFYEGVREISSGANGVFPLLHVLADLYECVGGTVIPTGGMDDSPGAECERGSDNPDDTTSLMVQRSSDAVLLLANLSPHQCTMRIPASFLPRTVRALDETAARRAAVDWRGFRGDRRSVTGMTSIELAAFATVRLDGELTIAGGNDK